MKKWWNNLNIKKQALMAWASLWIVISATNIGIGGLLVDTGATALKADVSGGWATAGIFGVIFVSALVAGVFTLVGGIFVKLFFPILKSVLMSQKSSL